MSRSERHAPLEEQRLLEGWLPLAQDANEQYGWGLGPAPLEALILAAAPALRRAHTALESRAMLWSTYNRLYPEQRTE